MFDKLANIFRIPDLRKRILFTLGMLFVYRLGGHLPTPGIDTAKLEQYLHAEQHQRIAARICRSVFGRPVAPHDDFCPGHHAVHHGIDHSAVADRGL